MSITLHDQFRRLRQGVVEAVNAQAGLTARPAGVEAPADDDPESLALVIDGIGMPIIGMAAFMFIGICMTFIMAVTPVGEAGVGANGADSRQRRRTGKMPVQQPSRALHGG